METVSIRKATAHDLRFLDAMLHEAANWRGSHKPEDQVSIAHPHIAKYLKNWGREGDFALVAENQEGERIGAVWYRFFPEEDPGFGFIEEDIPEITLAVERQYRGRGTGKALLESVIAHAIQSGIKALGLSVEAENRAVALYENAGFRKVTMVDNAWTMRRDLQ